MTRTFDIIVATDLERGIGKDGGLPWKLSQDMRHFKEITSTCDANRQNAVIMGRKTWESIPEKRRPLAGRLNVVLTRDADYKLPDGVIKCRSLDEALQVLDQDTVQEVFVIGGGEIYAQAMHHRQCRYLYLTEIMDRFNCDTVFPGYRTGFTQVSDPEEHCENGIKFAFKKYLHDDDSIEQIKEYSAI